MTGPVPDEAACGPLFFDLHTLRVLPLWQDISRRCP